jgi:hypothetical protein
LRRAEVVAVVLAAVVAVAVAVVHRREPVSIVVWGMRRVVPTVVPTMD